MMYPMDDSLGADDNEIVGCRCSVDFGYDSFEEKYGIRLLNDLQTTNKDSEWITEKAIKDSLSVNEVGEIILKILEDKEIKVFRHKITDFEIKYKLIPEKVMATHSSYGIKLFIERINTPFDLGMMLVHEVTHDVFGVANTKDQEVMCYMMQEYFAVGKMTNDTFSDIIDIVNTESFYKHLGWENGKPKDINEYIGILDSVFSRK